VRIPTIAVLTGPQPVDGDGVLRTELSAIGATVVDADGPAAAARAVASASAAGRVALVDRRLIAHRHALRLAIEDPRWTAAHSVGVLTVSGQARDLLATQLRTLPDLTAHRVEGASPAAKLTAPRPLVPDVLATRLAQSLPIHEVDLPNGLIATLVDAPLAARKDAYERVAHIDGEAIRLRKAVKSDDGLFATLFVSSYSRFLARWCADRGLSPNLVTTLSLLIAIVGAITAATGTRAGYITAAVALYVSFVLDCTDGQLARYALNFSRVGSWLDATFDRAKEYAVYAGLAFGSAHNGDDVWLLAALAMALQTVRHHVDFAFHEGNRGRGAAGANDGNTQPLPVTPEKSLTYWARKIIVLPIGERWALIALLTALTKPRTAFVALLVWGLIAAAYTTAGRVQRSLAPQAAGRTPEATEALYSMSDILARPLAEARRLGSKLGWLVPPVYHAFEYAIAIALAAEVHGAMPVAFLYLAAVIYHHYDVVYRIRAGVSVPRWLTVAGALGFEGRVVILVIASFIPAKPAHHALTYAFVALAVYLWALFLAESVHFWLRPAATVLLPADAA
jgi:phosphatidylglycerophosphate synthase